MQIKLKLLPLALLALSPNLFAQQIPGAGSQLRDVTPPILPQKNEPKIRIAESSAPATTEQSLAKVRVDQLLFSGTRIGSETDAELQAISRFTPGTEVNLRELEAMAGRITQHYREKGYFVARAYLPAQDISNHVVTIAISEGRLGKVELRNTSRLDDALANGLLEGLDTGEPITLKPLEHRLLLLSDVPGVTVKSTLVPGSTPGTSDLIVSVEDGDRVSGQVDIDNAGNPYTGEYRLGATVNLNNLAGRGDVASLRAVTSGKGLSYGRASYQMQFGLATAGVAYSRLEYALGKQFEVLGAHGTAEVASIFGSIPLIRSRESNLYFALGYDDKILKDELDLVPIANRRAHAGVATASLYGNHQDSIGAGGNSSFYLGFASGNLDIQTPSALLADAASAKTNGHYSKLLFSAARLQQISQHFSLYGSVNGQLASKNLDPSEKMVLGGMDGVRAYPQGEAFGDQGYVANLEARWLLNAGSENSVGDLQLIGFVDSGHVTINKDPWYAGPNNRNLSSYGVGLSWGDPGNFLVRTYYARKLGNELATSAPDKSGRFWIQAIKYF